MIEINKFMAEKTADAKPPIPVPIKIEPATAYKDRKHDTPDRPATTNSLIVRSSSAGCVTHDLISYLLLIKSPQVC